MSASSTSNAGPLLFELIKFWARRGTGQNTEVARQGRTVAVVEAVRALGVAAPVTINKIAQEMFIDQSGASRMVQDGTAAGYLEVRPSEQDGRQRVVILTPAGLEMLDDAAHWQVQIFNQLTDDWTTAERRAFQRGLERLIARSRKAHGQYRSFPG